MYNLQKSRENIDKFLPVYNRPSYPALPIVENNENESEIPDIPEIPDENTVTEDFEDDTTLSSSSTADIHEHGDDAYFYENKYYYMKNEKYLQKDFEAATIPENFQMQMCIYKCVRQGCTPFLMYLLQYHPTENMYTLPSRGASGAEETDIMEEFHQYLFDIFPPNEFQSAEETTDLYDPNIFKGFYNHKTSNDETAHDEATLTMVYDATRVNLPVTTTPTYIWATPYEIFVSGNIKETPINESVRATFIEIGDNEKDFHHLFTDKDTIVKNPYILFLCKAAAPSTIGFSFDNFLTEPNVAVDTAIVNDYDEQPESVNESFIKLLYPRVSHPLLGNYTFFSNNMLDARDTDPSALRRFAVFVDIPGLHPLYIEPDEMDKLNHLYDIDQTEQYSAITYRRTSDNSQLWCVKSSEYFLEI